MNFNETTETVAERTESTNYAGGQSFDPDSPQMELYTVVTNNLLEDKYYEDDVSSLNNIIDAFGKVAAEEPEFALKLAKYARQEMYLRQVPQLLLVLAANDERTQEYVEDYALSIMDRADEPLTALALQVKWYGTSIPRPLQRGIEDALHQFDEYQFAKYDRNNREFRYRDLMNLVHPKPRDDERKEIFRKIAYGELDDYEDVDKLRQHGTWEDAMSDAGKEDADPATVWREKLDRMGIMATIRNVRNMMQDGLSAEEILTQEKLDRVSDSKLYPFRVYTAYKALKDAGIDDAHADEWFSDALDESVGNMPRTFGDTYVGVDLSGSMESPLSENSTIMYKEISSLFGAVCYAMGAGVAGFGNTTHDFTFHRGTPVLQMTDSIRTADVGHSTNGWKVLNNLVKAGESYERVVLFTDMQMWDSSGRLTGSNSVKKYWDKYTDVVNPDASLYIVDLSSYGDLTMPEGYHNVYQVAGWNDNIIDHIQYADTPQTAINTVRAVSPDSE